jgi:hypothetical protein
MRNEHSVVQDRSALRAAGSAPELALDCFPDTAEHLLDPYHLHHSRSYRLQDPTVVTGPVRLPDPTMVVDPVSSRGAARAATTRVDPTMVVARPHEVAMGVSRAGPEDATVVTSAFRAAPRDLTRYDIPLPP